MNKTNSITKENEGLSKITFEEFKTIYKGYYKEVVKILRDNDFPFSAACGTMLGAVREKDMIEWDFDIDNFFFIEDIDKLLSIEKLLPDHYFMETYLDGKLRYGLVRIFCKNLYRHDRESSNYVNAFIDFFAVRNIQIDEEQRKRLYTKVLKDEQKVAYKYCEYKSKNFVKGWLKKLYQLSLPSFKRFTKKIEKKEKSFKEGSTCVMCRNFRLVSTLPIDKNDIVYVNFSGYDIPCYRNYEEVLTCLFGTNWRTPVVFEGRTIPEFYIK